MDKSAVFKLCSLTLLLTNKTVFMPPTCVFSCLNGKYVLVEQRTGVVLQRTGVVWQRTGVV